MKQDPGFLAYKATLRYNSVRLLCFLGVTVYPAFLILDNYMLPGRLPLLASIRGFNTLFCAILLCFTRGGRGQKLIKYLGAFPLTMTGLGVCYVVHLMGGYESVYYGGIAIFMLLIGIAFRGPWHEIAVMNTILFLGYFIPSLLGKITNIPIFITYTSFLSTTALLSAVGAWALDRNEYRSFKDRQEIEKAKNKLQALDRAKSEFFANVSHELKTPVSLILAPTETALQALSGESRSPFRKQLETIRHNAYRLSALIGDLLDLTRNEVGKAQLNPVKIQDTREYFERIFASVKPLMAEKGLQGEFVGGEGGEEAIASHLFDTAKIDKVVLNLLSNAIKFTPKGGKITMRVWDDVGAIHESPLRIQIEDTGIGIPEEKLPHIFDRFMQVDASSTRAYGGMGIGLSLVKDFVELHGGKVGVESKVGVGTKFTVTLPRGKEQFRAPVVEVDEAVSERDLPVLTRIQAMQEVRWEEEAGGLPAEASAKAGEGDTVLVVDDNAEMRRALGEVLKERFKVISAGGGEEGVRIARERIPDLILSDIMMPEKDGYGLLQDLRADSNPQVREIPVIFLTAKSGEENLLFGFKAGADDYITKPFSPKEVLARVGNLIRARKQSGQIKTQADTIMKITSQVAHDIRSPLTSINACVRYWKENTPQESDHLTMLELSAKRLQGIADDLLKGHSDGEREKVVFSLHRVLDEMIGEYTSFRDLNRIRFRKLFDHAINCIGNRDRIQRAFGNLLKNAVEAIDGEGEIVIKSEIRGREAIVSISDTGRGMTPEVLRRILEGGHSEGKREGHGIGMKVVREVIQENGWRIEAESLPGRGSTFRIYFPVPDSKQLKDVPPMEEGAGAIEITVGEEGQVVVIDDDPSVRLQWELIGKKKGFGVRGFGSWEEYEKRGGAELYKGGTAIIDHHFDNSELNGMEIVRRLRKKGFRNLYLCTAEYWKPVIRERAKELGVSICPKPIPRVVVTPPHPSLIQGEIASLSRGGRGAYEGYRVLVIDDDELIGITWKTLKEKLHIKDLYIFANLEGFLASGVDPSQVDIAFVDLNLSNSRYDGQKTIARLKKQGIPQVIVASGEGRGEKIPESIEECF